MPRIARIISPGHPHHITQRGNYQQNIFIDDEDRQKYLSLMKIECARYQVRVLAYCLMDNHIHFLAIPERENSLGDIFKYVNMKYAQYFHKRLGVKGHLFQGRFFSCVVDEAHLVMCAKYVERNPVRAKMVSQAWDWKWSSAKRHCGGDAKDELGVGTFFDYVDVGTGEWKRILAKEDEEKEIACIRRQTQRGRILGDDEFVKTLEKRLGRALQLKPRGRPRVGNLVSVPN